MNERARWMNKGFSSGGASGTNHQLFSATQDVVNHVVLSRGGPAATTKPMTNNFMPGSSQMNEPLNAFDQYAYQSLSESLQVALNQINQLNTTVKGMHDQLNRVQTEKNQLA